MFSRLLAAPVLGVLLVAPFMPASAQEKRPETGPASWAKPAKEKAAAPQAADLQHILLLTNGSVIVLSDGDEKQTSERKATDPAAAIRRALKELSGPADQLDLREVRKLLSEALSEMKLKSGGDFRVNVGGVRIAVPPLGPNPTAKTRGQPSQEAMHEEYRRQIHKLEMLIQDLDRLGKADQKRMAERQLEEARSALHKAMLEREKDAADAAVLPARINILTAPPEVLAQLSLRTTNEQPNENLTLTRRNGRYVARLIEPGVRITVTGPIQADPKVADAIVIEAGDDVSSYANVAAVPERHRAKVARLLDLARR